MRRAVLAELVFIGSLIFNTGVVIIISNAHVTCDGGLLGVEGARAVIARALSALVRKLTLTAWRAFGLSLCRLGATGFTLDACSGTGA